MRRSVLLMLLLALVLAGCGQPSVHSSDELQEDTHLAQQLFLADFSRNYEVLYVLTGDILEAAGDLSVVRKETELMENTSTRRFSPTICARSRTISCRKARRRRWMLIMKRFGSTRMRWPATRRSIRPCRRKWSRHCRDWQTFFRSKCPMS